MVQLTLKTTALLAIVAIAQGLPLWKRINQVTSDSKKEWEDACNKAGGKEQCNPIAVDAAGTLLAGADPCAQQNSADKMISLAKQLNNDPDMIRLAQIFAQQPRNSVDGNAAPYCQQAPANQELNGIFHCQFAGVNQKVFFGKVPVGQAGTIPLGQNAPVNPPGSCPANPSGPIPDGVQLVTIAGNPTGGSGNSTGNGSGSGSDNSSASTPTATASAPDASATAPPADNSSNGNGDDNDTDPCDDTTVTVTAPTATATATDSVTTPSATEDPAAAATTTPPAVMNAASNSSSGSGDFRAQNARDAQALNVKFATLTKDSPCDENEVACANGELAQCVSGKFVLSPCGSGEQCFALPLVNAPGTTVTCDSSENAKDRFGDAGVQGGTTGNDN